MRTQKLVLSERFRVCWSNLTPAAQLAIARGLTKLQKGLGRRKGLSMHRGVWELRVSRDLRITYEYGEDAIIARACGRHDILDEP